MRLCSRSSARSPAVLATYAAADLTYAPVGMTREPEPPAGFPALEQVAVVGSGDQAFGRLAEAVLRWELQRAAGVFVAATADVRPGATVVNGTGAGPLLLLAPCRVVYGVDEPGVRGFAYGTLSDHPVSGEERFTVELSDAGQVRLRIRSYSRPLGLARVSPPVSRALQRAVNRRYLAAGRRLATR